MNFSSQMIKKTFRITLAQLTALEKATDSVIGANRVSVLQLAEVNVKAGTAVLVKGNAKYEARLLASNGRWYLTGDYTFA